MIGIILISISWVLLRIEKRPLSALGFNHPKQRTLEFVIGFSVAAIFASVQYLSISAFGDFSWQVNSALSLSMIFESLRWNLNSVLFEELIFRGYLLYKAIELLGTKRACYLSAFCFGIYHWFSYNVLGDWVSMIYVFILTGLFGLLLAYSFAVTKSISLPFAIHLGWNLVTNSLFSNGPIGEQWLVPSVSELAPMAAWEQIMTSVFIPIGFVIFSLWLFTKKMKFHYAP